MQILNATQIAQKTKRLAIEILERNYGEREIIMAGVNRNGLEFSKRLSAAINEIDPSINLVQANLKLDPRNPVLSTAKLDIPIAEIEGKVVVIVDDVANTGRTIFYAMRPLLDVLPKKVEVAVMVDRRHKSFPVQSDYFGITLSTTLQEHIDVRLSGDDEGAYLL